MGGKAAESSSRMRLCLNLTCKAGYSALGHHQELEVVVDDVDVGVDDGENSCAGCAKLETTWNDDGSQQGVHDTPVCEGRGVPMRIELRS